MAKIDVDKHSPQQTVGLSLEQVWGLWSQNGFCYWAPESFRNEIINTIGKVRKKVRMWKKHKHADFLFPHRYYVKLISKGTCVCVLSHFSPVWLRATPWTAARQAPLPMGFSKQEYWRGLPCPPFRGSSQHKDWACVSYISQVHIHLE